MIMIDKRRDSDLTLLSEVSITSDHGAFPAESAFSFSKFDLGEKWGEVRQSTKLSIAKGYQMSGL